MKYPTEKDAKKPPPNVTAIEEAFQGSYVRYIWQYRTYIHCGISILRYIRQSIYMALSSTTLLADQEVAKTSLRLPKSLMKRMKLYAIESEKSVTEIVIEACNEYLQKRKY